MGDGIPDFLQPQNEQSPNIPTVPQQMFEFKFEPDSDPPPKKPSTIVYVFLSGVLGSSLYSISRLSVDLALGEDRRVPLDFTIFWGGVLGFVLSPCVIYLVQSGAIAKRLGIDSRKKRTVVFVTFGFVSLLWVGFTLASVIVHNLFNKYGLGQAITIFALLSPILGLSVKKLFGRSSE